MLIVESEKKLGEVIPNIALMLDQNHKRFGSKIVFQERKGDEFEGISWDEFYNKLENIAYNLQQFKYSTGDKILIFSQNRIEMLLLELAVMASGGVSVPIFFNYNSETVESLIKHSDAKYIAVGNETQLHKINPNIEITQIFSFDDSSDSSYKKLSPFSRLLEEKSDHSFRLKFDANPNEICLNMYTSGTMGKQKCVQLTHRNILSQQSALKGIWNIDENDRFLSFLRWHHSFGGIFEKFSALYNGAVISMESSQGLNPLTIMENWNIVKPTVFFSVPMIYHQLVDLSRKNKEIKRNFFHEDLKFVFTAAAPLPQFISKEFEKRKITVLEGWGLTETSPCCTITDPKFKREPGVIGRPIPGTLIRLVDDGEMQIKGPNVMVGYYKNPEANKSCFTDDGWFCTGDIGSLTDKGFKLITRKDRIFKLSNAEKIIPTELEENITSKCPYVSYALVEGNGRNHPVALLFPDKMLLNGSVQNNIIEIEHCDCPKNLNELSSCLKGCLINVNEGLKQKFARIKSAMLIDDELKVDNNTLTPSLKLSPANVKKIYKANIEKLYGAEKSITGNAFIISLDE